MQINYITCPRVSNIHSNMVHLVRLPVHLARCATAPVCVNTCTDEQDEMRDSISLSISARQEICDIKAEYLRCNQTQNHTNPHSCEIGIVEPDVQKECTADNTHDAGDQTRDKIEADVDARMRDALAEEQDEFDQGPDGNDGVLK